MTTQLFHVLLYYLIFVGLVSVVELAFLGALSQSTGNLNKSLNKVEKTSEVKDNE